jgi:tRNA(Ile)-lysidine synthase
MPERPRLTPAMADVRRAVRHALESHVVHDHHAVIVALSGGPDSLALAAATAFEAPRLGVHPLAVIVDHGLQPDSAEVAERAAHQASALGLNTRIEVVRVGTEGGPEAAARDARYAALAAVARDEDSPVLLGHTLDDQAETVLMGLVRGSGPTSLRGMSPAVQKGGVTYLRPLLGIRRTTTWASCTDQGLQPWHDPQNDDAAFLRSRVRNGVLPLLEEHMGPGVAEALTRTADALREDGDALDHMVDEMAEDLAEHVEAGIAWPVAALAANPPAIRNRLIRLAVQTEFHVTLTRAQTLEVARLVTDWHGQGPLHLPGVRVMRGDGRITFTQAPDAEGEALAAVPTPVVTRAGA